MVSISARPVEMHGKKPKEAVQIERWLFAISQNSRSQMVANLRKANGGASANVGDFADDEIGMLEMQKFTEETLQVKSKLMEGCRVVKSLLMSMPSWTMANKDHCQGRY